jgi:hypothetical protein
VDQVGKLHAIAVCEVASNVTFLFVQLVRSECDPTVVVSLYVCYDAGNNALRTQTNRLVGRIAPGSQGLPGFNGPQHFMPVPGEYVFKD